MTLAINGTPYDRLLTADWSDRSEGDYLNATHSFNAWRNLVIGADVLTETEFDALYALEGQIVSVDAPPYYDRNATEITYYGAELKKVTGQHNGPLVANVRLDLLVFVV